MILALWLARLLDWLSVACKRAADAVYRPHFRREARRATDRLIAETTPAIDELRRMHQTISDGRSTNRGR